MEDTEEVAIVGGGPAGAYCAFELARRGIYATIFDHSHPREKPCGGGITPLAIEKFPFLKQFPSKGGVSTDYKIISCTNRQAILTGLGKGFNISRRILDEEILTMAVENGAKFVKEKVIDAQKGPKAWRIETSKRIFSARILVGADGVNSLVRRKTVGAISKENLALTYGYMATGVEKTYSTMKYLDAIPGYIWIFPRDKQASIGIIGELKYGSMLKKLLDDFISSYCPRIKIISRFSALLPSAKDPAFFNLPCAGKDWILVGDAAGHVDPITGEGILYALWSGKLAADAIAGNEPKSYDKLWREEYGNDLIERCKSKDTFYDPLTIELSIIMGCLNKTFSWISE